MKFFNSNCKQANQTKSHWLLALSLCLMLITQTAHADFRKALTAYQARDGSTMLKEVKDAVDKKNDDGLILFISALQLDNILSTCQSYVGEMEENKIYVSVTQVNTPKTVLETLINSNEVTTLLNNLELASKRSTFEAQYEYLLLRYGDMHHRHRVIANNGAREKIMATQEFNRAKLRDEMKLLANKGYGKAAFYLGYPNMPQNHWYQMANKNGYQVELKSDTPAATPTIPYIQIPRYLPKSSEKIKDVPVLSIQRYATWAYPFQETNYFLDIYENGDVNFSRGILADIPRSKQRVIQKLAQSELKQLVDDFKALGYYNQPSFDSNGFGDDMGHSPSFGGFSITRTYLITLSKNNKAHTLNYVISEMDGALVNKIPPFLTSVFKRLEKTVPTQFYRCGVATVRDYYKHCVERDF